jgi:hypothetical protein
MSRRSAAIPCAASVRSDAASHPSSPWATPRDAALDEQVLARLVLELAPERTRAARHPGVLGVGAVRAGQEPGLAARGGAPVAGLELVDERHALAGPG